MLFLLSLHFVFGLDQKRKGLSPCFDSECESPGRVSLEPPAGPPTWPPVSRCSWFDQSKAFSGSCLFRQGGAFGGLSLTTLNFGEFLLHHRHTRARTHARAHTHAQMHKHTHKHTRTHTHSHTHTRGMNGKYIKANVNTCSSNNRWKLPFISTAWWSVRLTGIHRERK